MLIRFCVANYLSFHKQQCIDYSAAADRTLQSGHCIDTGYNAVPRLNRSAVLFGASASGKTNFFLALRHLRDLMRHSLSYSEAEFAAQYCPFQFDRSGASPTSFEIDLLIEGIRYRYTIALNAQRVMFERLLVYQGPKPQRWFERRVDPRTQQETWAPFSPSLAGAREMWRKSTRAQVPFIVAAAKLNADQFAPLTRWLQTQIEFALEFTDPGEFEALLVRLRDASFRKLVIDLLCAVGIPLRDIRIVSRTASHAQGSAVQIQSPYHNASAYIELQYTHLGIEPVWMPLGREAAGTQRLLSLLRPLLDSARDGKLVVIDNFDAAMHPLVTRFLLEFMNRRPSGPRQPQLLLSSHNTALMDLSILRRDEIWLVGLDDTYASQLSCLGGHGVRKGEMAGKNYLSGRYGGIPQIKHTVRGSSEPPPAPSCRA